MVNVMDRRKLEILCIQVTKWKGDLAKVLTRGYKFLHVGRDGRSNVIGIIVTEEGDQYRRYVNEEMATDDTHKSAGVYETNRNG